MEEGDHSFETVAGGDLEDFLAEGGGRADGLKADGYYRIGSNHQPMKHV